MCTGWRACLRLILAGAALVPLLPLGTLSAQPTSTRTADVRQPAPERPLGEVLMEFAAETGADLLYDPRLVAGLQVSADASAGSLADRLARFLSDTPLTFSRLPSGTYVLLPKESAPSSSGRIVGRVADVGSGRPLSSAHVILAGTGRAVATDSEGRFAIADLDPADYRLIVSHVGYQVLIDTVRVLPGGHARLDASLTLDEVAIAPLIVEDTKGLESVHRHDRIWPTRRLNGTPAGFSPDVVRSLNHLMGVRVGDVMADVHVQGGESGEHQFRLDGVPVFEPVHLRGLLGAFNPFALGRVTVHKAGFAAEHGSHLSGVISAEHALTAAEGRVLDVQVDPLSLNARLQGAWDLGSDVQARFMTAGRTSLWSVYPEQLYPPLKNLLREWNTPDFFLPQAWFFAFEQQDPELAARFEASMDSLDYDYTPVSDPELGFGDFHLAGDVRFGSNHLLYGSMYRGWNRLNGNRLSVPLSDGDPREVPGGVDPDDAYTDPDQKGTTSAHRDDYRWINATAQLRYDGIISDRSLFHARLRSSEYSLDHAYNALEGGYVYVLPLPDGWAAVRIGDDVRPTDNGNGIHEVALESSFDHEASRAFAFLVGAEAVNTQYRFAIEDVSDFRPLSDSSSTWRFTWFAQSKVDLSSRVQITSGTRFTAMPQRSGVYVEPRAELRYSVPLTRVGSFSTWMGGGIYRQFVNQFNVSSISPSVLLPAIRFWLPIDETVAPPKAYHLAGGMNVGPLKAWSLRGEAYYKHQPHLLFIDYVSLWDQRGNEESVRDQGQDHFLKSGRGYGFGGALSMARETARSRFLARYEFSIARRSRTLLAATDEVSPTPGEVVRARGYEPVPWNEPHRIETNFELEATDRFTLSGRWRSYWGRAWAFRQSYYDYLATDPLLSPSYGSSGYDLRRPEDHTLPPFHQLDLAATYSMAVGPTICQLRLDLLNVLDRQNEADWTLLPDDEAGDGNEYRVSARTMLPRTPSFTLRMRW